LQQLEMQQLAPGLQVGNWQHLYVGRLVTAKSAALNAIGSASS
jgi:hypothetical protein